VAGTNINGTDVTISLSGAAAEPKLTLGSVPSRPQDEILALVLFGRELETITPFQAMKLANAVRVLTGEVEDLNMLSSARSKLGLDSLDIESDDNNQTSVSSGKYVTDKVYVGIKQGATIESRKVVTELELSPSISAKTAVEGEGSQSFGVQWRKDY